MVMADISGRDRGQRRPRFPRKGPPFDNFVARPQPEKDVPVKTPVILTKPQTLNQVSCCVNSEETLGKGENNQSLKTQVGKVGSNNNHVKQSRPGILPADGYHLQQTQLYSSGSEEKTNGGLRLTLPPEMSQSVKVVDDQAWQDSGLDWLLDQPDFLVVGVIGMQGVGKSTILSHVAGTGLGQAHRSFAFKPQNRDAIQNGSHMTSGIDVYVTDERTILLDSQAIMSPSVLDALIYQEKKCPSEYSHVENTTEIQSLKIASFMFTVCNVVIIVVDWFVDPALFSFIRMAEMLKPLINNSGSDGSSHQDSNEYFPHVVFVLNKGSDSDFRPINRKEMCKMLTSHMTNSKLKFTGMSLSSKVPAPQTTDKAARAVGFKDSVNFFILPRKLEKKSYGGDVEKGSMDMQTRFVGHPGFDELVKELSYRLLSAPRQLPMPAAMSEKSWFHYAGRVWEFIKRSPLVSEYNRLLS